MAGDLYSLPCGKVRVDSFEFSDLVPLEFANLGSVVNAFC